MSQTDVEERVDALEDALRDLRRELRQSPLPCPRSLRSRGLRESRRTPPRGAFGLPRPPTPREAAAFARDDAIPATVAVLEAQVRALEATRTALRIVAGDATTDEPTRASRPHASAVGRTAVDRLDAALSDLADAIEDGALPGNETARALLRDARDLTDELAGEVDAARETRIPVEAATGEGGGPTEERRRERSRDVEEELDELRREFGADRETGADEDADDGPGRRGRR